MKEWVPPCDSRCPHPHSSTCIGNPCEMYTSESREDLIQREVLEKTKVLTIALLKGRVAITK